MKEKKNRKIKKRQAGRKGASDYPWPVYDIKPLGNQ